MKSYSSREVIKALKRDGWFFVASEGSHHHFKHPIKKGKVTVPHPRRHIPVNTMKNIEQQSGVVFPD